MIGPEKNCRTFYKAVTPGKILKLINVGPPSRVYDKDSNATS